VRRPRAPRWKEGDVSGGMRGGGVQSYGEVGIAFGVEREVSKLGGCGIEYGCAESPGSFDGDTYIMLSGISDVPG